MRTKILMPTRWEGDYINTFKILKITYNDNVELEEAIRNASKEFLSTKEGKDIFERNDKKWTYADIEFIPETISVKHGFCVEHIPVFKYEVPYDESILDTDDTL